MNTTERRTKAAELLTMVTTNPDNPSAGNFAQAAADLLAQCDEHEKQAHIREKAPELISLVRQMTEAMNRKPQEPSTKTAEQTVNQSVARSTAAALVQAATELEQIAALGTSQRLGGITVGSGLTPMLDETECFKLRERAKVYRDRAIAVLAEAGLTDLGYPLLTGCP